MNAESTLQSPAASSVHSQSMMNSLLASSREESATQAGMFAGNDQERDTRGNTLGFRESFAISGFDPWPRGGLNE